MTGYRCLAAAMYFLLSVSNGMAGTLAIRLYPSIQPPGAAIDQVTPGGPGDDAGLQRFDVITHINGKAIRGRDDCAAILNPLASGTTVTLTVYWDKKLHKVRARVAAANAKFKPPVLPEAVQDALTDIEDVGGTYKSDVRRPGKPVVSVVLYANRVSDGLLPRLQPLKSLESLTIKGSGGKLTAKGLGALGKLLALKNLSLVDSEKTDALLPGLAALSGLESLVLDGTDLTDAGLASIKNLKGLKSLSLRKTSVTDVGLGHVKGMVELTRLDLCLTKVRGAGLKHLAAMRKLDYLDLDSTQTTDIDLAPLAKLPISDLDLSRTRVTDAGLVHLKGMTGLTWLGLNYTGTKAKAQGTSGPGKAVVGSAGGETKSGAAGESGPSIGITAAGLMRHVAGLKNLRELQVKGHALEAYEVRDMGRRMRNTKFVTSLGTFEPLAARKPR